MSILYGCDLKIQHTLGKKSLAGSLNRQPLQDALREEFSAHYAKERILES